MHSIKKYLNINKGKYNYNFGRKYNNTLSVLRNKAIRFSDKIIIAHNEKNSKGEVIGIVVRADSKNWKALSKDLFFCFPAPVNEPYPDKVLDTAIIQDIVNLCDPTLDVDMEEDLDIAKLKLRLKLSQLGWDIEDVTG